MVDSKNTDCYRGCVKTEPSRRTRSAKRDYTGPAGVFKALSDPHRLRIFATIANAEDSVCVCDLTSELPLLQPTVSHHLRVLKEAGLVVSERRATWVYYRVAPNAAERFHMILEMVFPPAAAKITLRKTG